jgi:hypothetical protein
METKPLGIMPRKVWERGRKIELLNAMARYVEAGVAFPLEWAAELIALNREQSQEAKTPYKPVCKKNLEAVTAGDGSQSQNRVSDGLETATLETLLQDIIAAWSRPRYGPEMLTVEREMEWRGPLDDAVSKAFDALRQGKVSQEKSKNLLAKILEVWDDPGIQGEFYLVEELTFIVAEIREFLGSEGK